MLSRIELENFRSIRRAHLELDPLGTGIVGANASGKTSLLESIYFLAHGRSFRTAIRDRLLGPAEPFFRIVGTVTRADLAQVAGVEFSAGVTHMRLGGAAIAGISQIAAMLPVQIIDPSVHRLIEEGSSRRRRLLDWGVFHVEHQFLDPWRRYQRALAQRNAALRGGVAEPLVHTWNSELTSTACVIDESRRAYMAKLAPAFEELTGHLLGAPAEVSYKRGWLNDRPLSAALTESFERDLRSRATTAGPHRADLIFTVEEQPARERISRGQQKMLAAAFVLAQIVVGAGTMQQRTCLLLDDPAAELDVDNLGKLLEAIQKVPAQLVVTSLSKSGLDGIRIGEMFHVERGSFTPML